MFKIMHIFLTIGLAWAHIINVEVKMFTHITSSNFKVRKLCKTVSIYLTAIKNYGQKHGDKGNLLVLVSSTFNDICKKSV